MSIRISTTTNDDTVSGGGGLAALELRERALASLLWVPSSEETPLRRPPSLFFLVFIFLFFFPHFFHFLLVCCCATHTPHPPRHPLFSPRAAVRSSFFSCILSSQLVRLVWIAPALRLSARRSLCAFRRVAFSISWMTSASPLLVVCWRCCCGTTSVLVEFGNSSFPKLLPAMVLVPQSGCVSVWERAYICYLAD